MVKNESVHHITMIHLLQWGIFNYIHTYQPKITCFITNSIKHSFITTYLKHFRFTALNMNKLYDLRYAKLHVGHSVLFVLLI